MTENAEKVKSNPALIFFNDEIVNLKPVVKAAKANESQKLVRKIKQLNGKKGNEAQLEQNKRKCENLKKEIDHIKKLKFNDVAMFSFENEEENFVQYMSKNKKVSIDEISLARLAFNKKVVTAISKIKNNPKIEGWKTTFIQYKSRCEKRKSWKDKMTQMKEIESKLAILNQDSDAEESPETIPIEPTQDLVEPNADTNNNNASTKPKFEKDLKVGDADSKKKVNEKSSPRKDTSTTEPHKNKKMPKDLPSVDLKDSDDEEGSEEEFDGSDEDSEKSFKQMDLDYEMGGFSSNEEEEEEEESNSNDLLSDLLNKKATANNKENNEQKLVVVETKKTNRMIIKQFNLDEIKDFDEIPVQDSLATDSKAAEASESEDSGAESDDSYQATDKKKFTIKQDPFFLDDNGNEIVNEELDRERERYRNSRREETNNLNFGSYSSYDRHKEANKKTDPKESGSYPYKRKFTDASSENNHKRNKFDSDRKPGGGNFDRNSNYQQKNGSQIYNNNKTNNFAKPRNNAMSNGSNTNYSSGLNKSNGAGEKNLHPSWVAKKQMEERSKMKFEGKKLKFDD